LSVEAKLQVREDLVTFYNENKKNTLFMKVANDLATKHGMNAEDIRDHYKMVIYKELSSSNRSAVVRDGTLSVNKINPPPFFGWYWGTEILREGLL